MADDIRHQINGQLIDNTVNAGNREEMILVPVSIGSADEARIIAEMRAEDSGLREETILHVLELEKRVMERLLISGMHINNGFFRASVSFRGVIEDSKWNREKNAVVVNFNMGANLRKNMKRTEVNIIGEKGSTMYIGSMTDVSTRAQNASATAGRAFTLTGSKIKIAGTDESVGITLTDAGGVVTEITEDLYVANNPAKVTFIIPAGLADGAYTLMLSTQFTGATLLKTPRRVEKTIYIGQNPSGENEGEGDDEDVDNNPLG